MPKETMVAHTYQAASRQLLAQGREELAGGDIRQASENGWCAAAQMVKAIAEQRGWQHRNHAALFDAISFLVSETRDHEIRRLFHVANGLHTTFTRTGTTPRTSAAPWTTWSGFWTGWNRWCWQSKVPPR